MSNEIEQTKESKIKTVKEMKLWYLTYYILSFVVLFFKILTTANNTYRIGFIEFASGLGLIYYLANFFGLATVIVKPLESIQKLSIKVITIVNLVVSFIVLIFNVIPSAIGQSSNVVDFIFKGSIGIGFWMILGLHTIGFLVFWLKYIRSKMNNTEE